MSDTNDRLIDFVHAHRLGDFGNYKTTYVPSIYPGHPAIKVFAYDCAMPGEFAHFGENLRHYTIGADITGAEPFELWIDMHNTTRGQLAEWYGLVSYDSPPTPWCRAYEIENGVWPDVLWAYSRRGDDGSEKRLRSIFGEPVFLEDMRQALVLAIWLQVRRKGVLGG